MRNVRPVHQRTPSASEHELVMGAATPVGRPPGRRTPPSSWRSSPSARNQPHLTGQLLVVEGGNSIQKNTGWHDEPCGPSRCCGRGCSPPV